MSAEIWVLVAILILATGFGLAVRPFALFRTGNRAGQDPLEAEALARHNLDEAEAPLPLSPEKTVVQARVESGNGSPPSNGASSAGSRADRKRMKVEG